MTARYVTAVVEVVLRSTAEVKYHRVELVYWMNKSCIHDLNMSAYISAVRCILMCEQVLTSLTTVLYVLLW